MVARVALARQILFELGDDSKALSTQAHNVRRDASGLVDRLSLNACYRTDFQEVPGKHFVLACFWCGMGDSHRVVLLCKWGNSCNKGTGNSQPKQGGNYSARFGSARVTVFQLGFLKFVEI